MIVNEEEYEIVGYVKKICICEKCNTIMEKQNYEYLSNPPKYIMKCPKCGKEESIESDKIQDGIKIIRKENK